MVRPHLGSRRRREARLSQRLALRQREEFDTPWPVPDADVCISFIHIPTLFDDGRSQRIFNLINKDTGLRAARRTPGVLSIVGGGARHRRGTARHQRQRRRTAHRQRRVARRLAAHTSAGTVPNFTLSMQSAWMLDDFRVENGATHVVRGSHLTLRKPPKGGTTIDGEVVLEGPAGSVAHVALADLAPPRREHHRRDTARCDRPVRALLGEAVRRPAHADDGRAGGRAVTPAPLHHGLQRQRARAGLRRVKTVSDPRRLRGGNRLRVAQSRPVRYGSCPEPSVRSFR